MLPSRAMATDVDEQGAAPYAPVMSIEVVYLLRKDEPGFRDLDAVVLLAPVVSHEGDTIPEGRAGTVVGVWTDSPDCIVEFSEPDGALATVPASLLTHATPTNLR